jgi:hypothetical protein
MDAMDRILSGLAHLGDALFRFHTIPRVRAFIVGAVGRICADNRKVFARIDQPMASARWQDDHVTGGQGQDASFDATAFNTGAASGHAQHFVDLRVVVYEIVDGIPP